MAARLALVLLLVAGLRSCVRYEFEHEFWLDVDGSGRVNVTGRPDLCYPVSPVPTGPTTQPVGPTKIACGVEGREAADRFGKEHA